MIFNRTNMNALSAIVLLHAYGITTVSAFLLHPLLPFENVYVRLPSAPDVAGQPLFLTPLIDAGKVEEAKIQALVPPFLDNIVSYSGFLTVNRISKSHLFFWFVPRTEFENATSTSPLILWLQGGPGCSSLYGLFSENGPFEYTENGLQRRQYAWTNHYHMLYIDQPVGTGFSFTEDESNGYISTQAEAATHLYEALVQFYALFPNLLDHDFYIAGESYAGKFVPSLGHKIHLANQEPEALQIPLKGMMIGNGFSDPLRMMEYGEYLFNIGLIDKSERHQLEYTQEEIKYMIQSHQWSLGVDQYFSLGSSIINALNFSNLYDYTKNDLQGESPFVKFITQDEIRRRIHVGSAYYEECSQLVNDQFLLDFLKSVREEVEDLLDYYPMLFYNGQFDIVCPHAHSQNFLRSLHWSGAYQYGSATRQVWRVDNTVAGYFKTSSYLIDVFVRNAGHMVPADVPKNALVLIDSFIGKQFQ